MKKLKILVIFFAINSLMTECSEALKMSGLNPKPQTSNIETSDIFEIIQTSTDPNILDILYKNDPNIFKNKNHLQQTPLMVAIKNNNIAFITKLLEKYPLDILIDAKDIYGNTALHYAIDRSLSEATYFLIKAKTNINAQNNLGQTPLHIAFEKNNYDAADLLLASKANPNLTDHLKRTPLHILAKHLDDNGQINTLLLSKLIKHGANVNAQDQVGLSPLHIVLTKFGNKNNQIQDDFNRINFARLLLKYKANPNIQDKYNYNPLHLAVLFYEDKLDANLNKIYQNLIKDLQTKENLGAKNINNEYAYDLVRKFEKTELYPLFPIELLPILKPVQPNFLKLNPYADINKKI